MAFADDFIEINTNSQGMVSKLQSPVNSASDLTEINADKHARRGYQLVRKKRSNLSRQFKRTRKLLRFPDQKLCSTGTSLFTNQLNNDKVKIQLSTTRLNVRPVQKEVFFAQPHSLLKLRRDRRINRNTLFSRQFKHRLQTRGWFWQNDYRKTSKGIDNIRFSNAYAGCNIKYFMRKSTRKQVGSFCTSTANLCDKLDIETSLEKPTIPDRDRSILEFKNSQDYQIHQDTNICLTNTNVETPETSYFCNPNGSSASSMNLLLGSLSSQAPIYEETCCCHKSLEVCQRYETANNEILGENKLIRAEGSTDAMRTTNSSNEPNQNPDVECDKVDSETKNGDDEPPFFPPPASDGDFGNPDVLTLGVRIKLVFDTSSPNRDLHSQLVSSGVELSFDPFDVDTEMPMDLSCAHY